MEQVSDNIRKFFEAYERGIATSDPELLASQYNDSFMFASPQGAQAIQKADFLKALPRRQGFVKSVGLIASTIQSLEETRLDDYYIMVKADWQMRFKKDSEDLIIETISATYLLQQQEYGLRIVFQLDHQDLMKRIQDLGLVSTGG